MPPLPKTAAVIVAAGRGSRADTGAGTAKQYISIAGRPVLTWTMQAFLSHPRIDLTQVVIHADDRDLYDSCRPTDQSGLLPPVTGGATRQASVRRGLEALDPHAPDYVLIHDAARPLVDHTAITASVEALAASEGVIVALPMGDTVKRVATEGNIADTVERSGLWRAQTPQAFHFKAICDAHAKAAENGKDRFTDDAAIAVFAGIETKVIEGRPDNIKITTPGDFALAERLLPALGPDIRNGQGFDVHRFGPGDHVCLCGIEIVHSQALLGHSDADVAMHALTDAILGTIADGDIGQHYPPSDERWRGAASEIFLRDACRRLSERGARLTHVDVTIICEQPKIGPHRDAMRHNLARLLAIDVSRVSVKATTTEGLGFTGRGEGIAAMASATVQFRDGFKPTV